MTTYKSETLPGTQARYFPLSQLGDTSKLPMTVKILLEQMVRAAATGGASDRDIAALAKYPAPPPEGASVPFRPMRILLQDFTGVPAAVDLAAMRSAMKRAGKDPARIEPLIPVDLVIDHSVQADFFGAKDVYERNLQREYERNRERYSVLRWAGQAFKTFRVVPPGAGICHQVNLERLCRVVQLRDGVAMPDTLFGADSHTTMVNGLGVLGWGVGGIEAEAAMLGQPTYMPWPVVVGVTLVGSLPTGTTATDLVLTLTEKVRKHGVVNKFVEFAGDGLSSLTVQDRATVSNMCPEYGSTASYFPVDAQSLRYLEQTGRGELIDLVERYTKAQGLFRVDGAPAPVFAEHLELDLATIRRASPGQSGHRTELSCRWSGSRSSARSRRVASRSRARPRARSRSTMPRRPRWRSPRTSPPTSHTSRRRPAASRTAPWSSRRSLRARTLEPVRDDRRRSPREEGDRARAHGAASVKTTMAPGSRVVTRYLDRAGLTPYLEKLGYYLVGYGCTVCIGQTGPLATPEIEQEVKERDLNVVAVLSGNRNFEGRIHPLVKSSYLASPRSSSPTRWRATVKIDLADQPIGNGKDGKPVFLKDIWPTQKRSTR
jgi:aconitate hydratase